MTQKFMEETNRDFQDFMETEPVSPPRALREEILKRVHTDLNPSAWLIFSKLSLIHLLVGIVTLSLCPQFGVRVAGEGLGLMHFFLAFGAYGCIALCGTFFVGSTLFVSGFILRGEELKVLRSHRWLQISALTLLSLGALVMADAEILVGFATAWILGAVVGGIALLEAGRFLKRAVF